MKTTNTVFIGFFGILGIAATIAALTTAPHQGFIAAICATLVVALYNDNLNLKNEKQ